MIRGRRPKLSEEQMNDVVNAFNIGEKTAKQLAVDYQVSVGTVYSIVNRLTDVNRNLELEPDYDPTAKDQRDLESYMVKMETK